MSRCGHPGIQEKLAQAELLGKQRDELITLKNQRVLDLELGLKASELQVKDLTAIIRSAHERMEDLSGQKLPKTVYLDHRFGEKIQGCRYSAVSTQRAGPCDDPASRQGGKHAVDHTAGESFDKKKAENHTSTHTQRPADTDR